MKSQADSTSGKEEKRREKKRREEDRVNAMTGNKHITDRIDTMKSKSQISGFSEGDLAILMTASLFQGIGNPDLKSLLNCLQAVNKKFGKGAFIQREGEPFERIGIVIKGAVEVIQEDALGRKTILTSIGRAGIFGEAIVTAQLPESPVSVVASEDATVCLLNYRAMVTTCEDNCIFHHRLIRNMLEIMARKTLLLSKKLNYALMKNIRDKITSYLLDEFQHKHKNMLVIPYNREELADYLSVDRSALSRELSRMRADGLIRYRKNEFILDFVKTAEHEQGTGFSGMNA